MHVALLSPAWPPELHPNGIVTYVHWMREGLRQAGHRVSIFTGRLDAPEASVHPVEPTAWYRGAGWLGAKLKGARSFPFLRWGGPCAAAILAIHRRHRIDVIEMEESFGWAADVAQSTSIPLVVKLHGPAFMSLVDEELQTPFAAVKIRREGEALLRLPVITSPARCTLDLTLARYGLAPTFARHIVNPLNLAAGTPLWSLDACDRRTLLFVGRFDKRKGGDLVLHAFARLLQTHPDLTLVFVGPDTGIVDDAGHRLHFEAMKATLFTGPAADRVVYRGQLGPAEIARLRVSALITMIASRWENQGYTALEAMLQGCPLVSSDAGGQPEIIVDGMSGLLARSGSSEDLALKLATLVDDPERAAALGRGARGHVLQHHAPASVVAQTIAAYEAAIAFGTRSGRSVAPATAA